MNAEPGAEQDEAAAPAPSERRAGLSRRTVVRTGANAAWLAPTVSVVAATPAFAVTGPSGPSAFSNLVTPAYTDDTQAVVFSGTIQPAFAGRPVSLRKVNSDGTTEYIANANADANGNFVFARAVTEQTTFRFYSQAQTQGAITYGAATSADFTVRALYFYDNFAYTNVSQLQERWTLRAPADYGGADTPHSKSSWDAAGFNADGLILKTIPDGTGADGKPLFKMLRMHVNTADMNNMIYGNIEARIRFGPNPSFHGAVWYKSGYGPGKGEFDIAEFFGRDTQSDISQWMNHAIHNSATNGGATTEWGGRTWTGVKRYEMSATNKVFTKTNFAPSDHYTFWQDWHVYRGDWAADKYSFFIDDQLMGTIGQANGVTPSSIVGNVILSMKLNEPGYYDDLVAFLANGGSISTMYMYVDYIRVWR